MADTDYLKRILTSRVYDIVDESPLENASELSTRLGNRVLLKREDLQAVFSFKIRGAYNKMAGLSAEQLAKGVIASSAGNHAQGVAMSAKILGCSATIVMPATTPEVKIQAVRALEAEVVLHGDSYTDAFVRATEIMETRSLTFVHPFDDPDVIAGQGTIALEILRQYTTDIHAIFVPIGGGGLISGIASYCKQLKPDIQIIGVQTVDSDAMAQSVNAGQRVELAHVGLFADGTAVRLVGEETFRLVSQYVDDIILVDTDAVCAAIKDMFSDTRAILEPSGALAIAGMKKYLETAAGRSVRDQTLVAVTTGANMNFDRLRFVSERAEVGEQREAVFAVTIPERPGSFRQFCDVLGEDRSVTEFNYRMAGAETASVFVGVQVRSREEGQELATSFRLAGFDTLDLTDDELSKLHLRHLVGGRSTLAKGERIYRFEFPEQPGALVRFLAAIHPDWNISLFHYRNHGADYGRVLCGIQISSATPQSELTEFLNTLGYVYREETDNPAYQLFLASQEA